MRETVYYTKRLREATKLVVTLGVAEIVPNHDEGKMVLEALLTLAEAENVARTSSLWHSTCGIFPENTPVYVYHADSCEPVSVWVNGERVRLGTKISRRIY